MIEITTKSSTNVNAFFFMAISLASTVCLFASLPETRLPSFRYDCSAWFYVRYINIIGRPAAGIPGRGALRANEHDSSAFSKPGDKANITQTNELCFGPLEDPTRPGQLFPASRHPMAQGPRYKRHKTPK
jgi:hypothetical protein